MIKRHKELKVVTKEMESLIDKKGYIPKSGGHVGKTFGSITIICYLNYKGLKMILRCDCCHKKYHMRWVSDGTNLLLTDCHCHNKKIDQKVKLAFNIKKLSKGQGEYWCTGCESYRGTHNRADRYCDICYYLSKNVLTLYETFDEIMARWEPTTHKPCTMKLPYLYGTSRKGFKIRGFTYVSEEDYDWCSKLLWIKVKGYVKATCSKDNCKRVEEPIKDLYGYYFYYTDAYLTWIRKIL